MNNGFEQYEASCDKVWIYRLRCTFNQVNDQIFKHTGNELKMPIWKINHNVKSSWGSWTPSTRVLMLSGKLLRNFEWGAVQHVIKHEMAHMIVSEIFDMDCYGVAHGAAWERACKIVDIEPRRCDSANYLSEFKGYESSSMVDKIRKILIHANDSSITEEEAETFMRKAKELMLRHDIEMRDVMGTDRVWVSRPFGGLYKRWPSYMWTLGRLLKYHYNVENLCTYGPNGTSRLELFGEPDNLDIAEYVGHALLNQAELLYEAHKAKVHKEKAEERKRRKEDGVVGYHRQTRLSKKAYIEGLISGYAEKLMQDEKAAKRRVGEEFAKNAAKESGKEWNGEQAVVPVYDTKLLREMYENNYPSLRNCSISSSRGSGYGSGHVAGSNLTLSKGVSSNGNNGRLLS